MSGGPERKRRLFVGIELDDDARTACTAVAAQLSKTGYAARYELPEKLHVTLAFLGYVEPPRLDEILYALQAASRSASEFGVVLDKVGAFPHERKPRVVYVGAREQGAAFRRLAAGVRARYASLGFAFRDDPVAHVTIARVKPPVRPLPAIEFAAISLRVGALTLFESRPDMARNTSRYIALDTVRLGREA